MAKKNEQSVAVVYCYNKKITYQRNGKELSFNKLKAVYTHEDGKRTFYDLIICNAIKEQFNAELDGVNGYPINLTINDYFTKEENQNGFPTIKLFVKGYSGMQHVESISKSLEDIR